MSVVPWPSMSANVSNVHSRRRSLRGLRSTSRRLCSLRTCVLMSGSTCPTLSQPGPADITPACEHIATLCLSVCRVCPTEADVLIKMTVSRCCPCVCVPLFSFVTIAQMTDGSICASAVMRPVITITVELVGHLS